MLTDNQSKELKWHISRIAGLTKDKFDSMVEYIKDEIESFLTSGTEFTMGDFAGGERYDWTGTPLEPLYWLYFKKYNCTSQDNKRAIKAAGRACGLILRHVLVTDKRRIVQMPGRKAVYQTENAFLKAKEDARNKAMNWNTGSKSRNLREIEKQKNQIRSLGIKYGLLEDFKSNLLC